MVRVEVAVSALKVAVPENAGAFENTRRPEPVSSVTAEMRFALDGVASHAAMPVPSPEIPVATGRPVALVRVTDVGVPRTGVVRVGDVPKTSAPLPVSFVIESMRYWLVAVVVARDEESKNSPREAVCPEKVVIPERVAADIDGEVRVFAVKVCVPPTVTTDAEFVPAVVTRRSPVDIVSIPEECVKTAFPLSKLMTAPVSKKRSSQATVPEPRSAPPSEDGSKLVPTVAVLRTGDVNVFAVKV
jgi:hypothetical protein